MLQLKYIGNWKLRTMFETAKAGQVAQEIEWYICKLDILGI